MVAGALAVAASGFAIFVASGALLLRAAGLRFARGESFAQAFAASLVLLTATFAALLAFSQPLSSAPPVLVLVTLASCGLLRGLSGTTALRPGSGPRDEEVTPPEAAFPRFAWILLALASVAAAVAFAPVGSVDRWWYLAYIRSFAEAPALSLAEPFLGSGQPFARFGVHPWLFGLALWSNVSGVDAVVLYERGAPVVAVLASLSATTAMMRALLRGAGLRRLAMIAAVLLWCGGLVPLLARAGEDKILAAGALMPLALSSLLALLRSEGRPRDALPLLLACSATAAVHSLDYAFVLVVALPVATLALVRGRASSHDGTGRRSAILALAVMLAVAVLPAASGLVVRSRLHEIGAELSASDHPVVRVHEGRDRLVGIPPAGFVVSPRLMLHPLALLALLALFPLLRGESRREGGTAADDDWTDGHARDFVLVATLLPLLLAFVPPLPLLAGSVIPPWMVYRVLWLVPVAPLAAVAIRLLAARRGHGEAVATMALLLLAAPVVADSAHYRLAEVRGRLAAPRSEGFASFVAALRALPPDAVVVAAPELAERLPALAARAVVAALDRSTIVFSGSRESGEARLRARAALLAGDDDGAALASGAGGKPSHAVFDPRSAVRPRCADGAQAWDGWALCRLDLRGSDSPALEALEILDVPRAAQGTPEGGAAPSRVVAEGTCSEAGPSSGRDPWSAHAPVVECRVTLPDGVREGLFLQVDASTGRAADELRIVARDLGLAVARVHGDSSTTVALPRTRGEILDVRVESSFLPFVKVRRVAVTAR